MPEEEAGGSRTGGETHGARWTAARDTVGPARACRVAQNAQGVVEGDVIAVFPILVDPVDVKKGDQLCETVSQPSIQPDKMDRPMGS